MNLDSDDVNRFSVTASLLDENIIWSALRHGEIGTGEAAHIARGIDASWHAARRRAGIGRGKKST